MWMSWEESDSGPAMDDQSDQRSHGISDSTRFSPQIRRIFPSGKILENEGNIQYLSGKIR